MGIFDRFKTKTQFYLDGNEFNNSKDCEYFCELSRMDKNAAKTVLQYHKLTFDNSNKLIRKEEYWKGKLRGEITLTDEEKEYEYVDYSINIPGDLIKNKNGAHYFGGDKPNDLELPMLKGTVVAYMGKISKEEKLFDWLDFDLHLVCPIFLDFSDSISIDYSNPLKPVFINKEEIEDNHLCDAQAMQLIDPFAVYSKVNFSFVENNSFGNLPEKTIEEAIANPSNSVGSFGIPRWDYDPVLPYCPKTGLKMKFILNTYGISEAKLLSDVPRSINQGESKSMDMEDGNLHIFFQPESKVLTYFSNYT